MKLRIPYRVYEKANTVAWRAFNITLRNARHAHRAESASEEESEMAALQAYYKVISSNKDVDDV